MVLTVIQLHLLLEAYNFSDESVEWFKSYLEGRTQTVQVESKFSDPEPLAEHGVPQGSVLGPLIFIIFKADILLIHTIQEW